MGKKTREIITETDSLGNEKSKTIEKEVIEINEAGEENPYEFMTNAELAAELKRLQKLLSA
jgi:hypothetical protein